MPQPRLYFAQSALSTNINTLVLAVDTQMGVSTLKLKSVVDEDAKKFEVYDVGLIRGRGAGAGNGFLQRPASGAGSITFQPGDPNNPAASQVWLFQHLALYSLIAQPPPVGSSTLSVLTATAADQEVTLSAFDPLNIQQGQLWKFRLERPL